MDIKKIEFSNLDFRLHCPYCKKLILSEGNEDITDECEHLIFIYDNFENQFIKESKEVSSSYDVAMKLADEFEGLEFDEFVEHYSIADQHAVGIYIYDETASYPGGIWFGFKSF